MMSTTHNVEFVTPKRRILLDHNLDLGIGTVFPKGLDITKKLRGVRGSIVYQTGFLNPQFIYMKKWRNKYSKWTKGMRNLRSPGVWSGWVECDLYIVETCVWILFDS